MENTTLVPTKTGKRTRAWHSYMFYVSDRMAMVARALAAREEAITGRQVGAGQIIDRAMRRYVAELLTPEEVAEIVRAAGVSNGHTDD